MRSNRPDAENMDSRKRFGDVAQRREVRRRLRGLQAEVVGELQTGVVSWNRLMYVARNNHFPLSLLSQVVHRKRTLACLPASSKLFWKHQRRH